MSEQVRRAAEILRAGGLVAFPTETVYGLGADASSEVALQKLYALKRRPAAHPVIVHFASAERAFEWAREVPEAARRLAVRFWPGPLSLILKRSGKAGDCVSGGQDTVGLRVPSHPVAQALLHEFSSGVAAPSANLFGRVSATSASHVKEDFPAGVDFVLQGEAGEVGIESTIVDFSRERAVLLRPGAITLAMLEQALGGPVAAADAGAPRASGTLERHYAPNTPLRLVSPHELDTEIARCGAKVAVLAFSRPDARAARWLRVPRDPAGYAHGLYAALRELDAAGCAQILVEQPPQTPDWLAVRDRLRRAASAT